MSLLAFVVFFACLLYGLIVFFFFQAEDGIRDIGVTGVQTCALPISAWVYLERGALLPLIVVPAIPGVMLGSRLGARLLGSTPAPVVRLLLIVVMLLAGLRALSRGLGVWA